MPGFFGVNVKKSQQNNINNMTTAMTFDEIIATSIFTMCCAYIVFVFITTGTFKKKRP